MKIKQSSPTKTKKQDETNFPVNSQANKMVVKDCRLKHWRELVNFVLECVTLSATTEQPSQAQETHLARI
jgi:hypothetical protein